MRIASIADLLRQQPLLRDLDPADVELLAACGRNEVFPASAVLARETETADRFYVVRAGRVALELAAPTGPLVIETLGQGDMVGWSWIFPPYRWTCDVEALEPTKAIAIDGACLRARCERDPAFGYRMMQRFAQLAAQRLNTTRLRLLDLYGTPDAR
jgi:CRP/FNR family transcriptional regulator, cyclic AMP receptor protein